MNFSKTFSIIIAVFVLTLGAYLAFPQGYQWQTTHNGWSSGQVRLESVIFRATIHPLHIDIEEEAVIGTTGDVWNGDAKTLEIAGTYAATKGTTIRSLLLWNGDKILKAKMMDKRKADSLYEATVDRQKPQVFPRDPAMIYMISPDVYQIKIYPVEIGKSRKIRVLYTLPKQSSSMTEFSFKSIFMDGMPAAQIPSQFKFYAKYAAGNKNQYTLLSTVGARLLEEGVTYLLHTSDFFTPSSVWWANQGSVQFDIEAQNEQKTLAFTQKNTSGGVTSNYSIVLGPTPDALNQEILDWEKERYSFELRVKNGSETYSTTVSVGNSYNLYLKSASSWDHKLSWKLWKGKDLVGEYIEDVSVDSTSLSNKYIPMLWGIQQTMVEKNGNWGAYYGFIDNRMSLLALEADSLRGELASKYIESGVPELLPNEILVDLSKYPKLPSESFSMDQQQPAQTGITTKDGLYISFLGSKFLPGNILKIMLSQASGKTATIKIYNLQGKLVLQTSVQIKNDNGFELQLNKSLSGKFQMVIEIEQKIFKTSIEMR